MDARKLQSLRNLGNECEEAADEIDRLTRELAEARETLQFVERWANHHGVNPRTTTAEALGVIQHHPAILEITDSYVDGKRPTTRNPYAELAEAKARIAELEADAEIGKRWRENSSLEEWFPITAEEIDRLRAEVEALRADKERIEEVQNEYLRIEPFEMRTPGGDDADVGWRIYTHHQQTPRLREVACHYDDDLRAAIDTAIAARKGEGSES